MENLINEAHSKSVSHDEIKREVVGKLNFKCEHCLKVLASKTSLKRHKLTVHEGIKTYYYRYHCELCSKYFDRLSLLQTHKERWHEVVKKFKCLLCVLVFENSKDIQEHIKIVHKGTYRRVSISHETIIRKIPIDIESPKTGHNPGLVQKNSKKLKVKSQTSLKKKKSNYLKNELVANHKQSALNNLSSEEYVNQISNNYKCNFCFLAFSEQAILKRHINFVHFGPLSQNYTFETTGKVVNQWIVFEKPVKNENPLLMCDPRSLNTHQRNDFNVQMEFIDVEDFESGHVDKYNEESCQDVQVEAEIKDEKPITKNPSLCLIRITPDFCKMCEKYFCDKIALQDHCSDVHSNDSKKDTFNSNHTNKRLLGSCVEKSNWSSKKFEMFQNQTKLNIFENSYPGGNENSRNKLSKFISKMYVKETFNTDQTLEGLQVSMVEKSSPASKKGKKVQKENGDKGNKVNVLENPNQHGAEYSKCKLSKLSICLTKFVPNFCEICKIYFCNKNALESHNNIHTEKYLVDEDCHSDLERYLTPEDTIEPESSLPSIEELAKNVQNLIDKDYPQTKENKTIGQESFEIYESEPDNDLSLALIALESAQQQNDLANVEQISSNTTRNHNFENDELDSLSFEEFSSLFDNYENLESEAQKKLDDYMKRLAEI